MSQTNNISVLKDRSISCDIDFQPIIRLARTPEDIRAVQRLRYHVFYEENGAKATPEIEKARRDFDEFDDLADHLIVEICEDGVPEIVGTYRLLRSDMAAQIGRYYTQSEYDISPLINSRMSLLELGRSCVLEPYRTRPILQMLWQGIAEYISVHNIDLMFGCASFQGTDIKVLEKPLSYLHHFHPCPAHLKPRALDDRYVDMNILDDKNVNPREIFSAMPPLIKGYLRVGATIGDGAVIDHDFNTTDICVVVQTHLITDRYRKHYKL